ncbi:MAG: hypothetical protein IT342_12905 [Candidatus Melainabacteria bacterium]|nr:hypothetical protein [Candidatus Melainabacteria bacterium]
MYNFHMRFWNLTLLTGILLGSVAPAESADADKRKIAVQSAAPLQANATHNSAATFAKSVAPVLRFRARLISVVDGAVAKVGDPVHAELLDTVMLPSGHYVGAGAHVLGEISELDHSKSLLKADFTAKHWRNCNGTVSMKIKSIGGYELMSEVVPAPKTRIVRTDKKAAPLGVDGKGEITVQYNSVGYTAASAAISGGCIAAGPAGIIVGPIVGGVAGATDPTFAYGRPVTSADQHAHLKGFFKGVIGGLPGGFLISGVTNRGINISLNPGDIIVFEERGQASAD